MIVCANINLGLTISLALTKSHQNNLTRLDEETEAQRSKKLAQLTQLKGPERVLEAKVLICSGTAQVTLLLLKTKQNQKILQDLEAVLA